MNIRAIVLLVPIIMFFILSDSVVSVANKVAQVSKAKAIITERGISLDLRKSCGLIKQ